MSYAGNLFLSRTIQNAGRLTLIGTDALYFGRNSPNEPGTLTNLPGGTFTVVGEPDFRKNGSNQPNTVINQGTFIHSGAGTTQFTDVGFNNTGFLRIDQGNLYLDSGGTDLAFNTSAAISTVEGTTLRLTHSVVGSTTNADQFLPKGTITLVGGSAGNPRQFEAMSRDLGATTAAFSRNFSYSTLVLDSAYIQLIDAADNATGSGDEAL